jgi:UDP-N-acetylmuramate dehydrogenase
MNAGAYGGEIKDVVKKVTLFDTVTNETAELSADEMKFGYRRSIVKDHPYIVLEAEFEMTPGDSGTIKETMDDLANRRRDKQPLEYPSAGSTFKRPEGLFAGKLIEDTGLKGFSVGDAAVSEKHCGFVINKGKATSADIYELISQVIEKVYDKTGVVLEPEIKLLGFDE